MTPRLDLHPHRALRLALIPSLAVAALATAAGGVAAARPQAPPPLTISPLPGTPDASPSTQISILGVPPDRIRSVAVTGSVSGEHAGSLHDYSGGRGASFVLRHLLAQGEHVAVVVRMAGRPADSFSFTVARLDPLPPFIDIVKTQPAKLQHFVSRPNLLPPRVAVSKLTPGLSGDIFLTPVPSAIVHPESDNELTVNPVGPGGPMIIDRHGRLVWFHQVNPPDVAVNFRPQRLDGREVLTWWQGRVTVAAFGSGAGMVADTSYRTIKVVRAGNGYTADPHEFLLTPSGDALFTVDSVVHVHVPGSPPGTLTSLIDSIVQEVDVRTGLVVWEWHSLGHIPLGASYVDPSNSYYYDAYHLNSIQALPDGRVLVSARDTSAIYEIDRATGRILWTLGGKDSSFRLGRDATFHFQHDAQALPGDEVSMFDDEGGPPSYAPSSRGLILKLDSRHHTADVVHQYRRPSDTLANSEGSVQTLAGGDELVGFGSTQFFAQFTSAGKLLYNASLPADDGSYRVFSYPWSATPPTRPAVAVRRTSSGRLAVYASWNGATTVARWQVLAGPSDSKLAPVATAPDAAFETKIALATSAPTIAVRAVGSHGQVLATSAPVTTS